MEEARTKPKEVLEAQEAELAKDQELSTAIRIRTGDVVANGMPEEEYRGGFWFARSILTAQTEAAGEKLTQIRSAEASAFLAMRPKFSGQADVAKILTKEQLVVREANLEFYHAVGVLRIRTEVFAKNHPGGYISFWLGALDAYNLYGSPIK